MRRSWCLLILLLAFQFSYSQKQTTFWQFGLFGGLNFSTGTAVPFNSTIDQAEGVASISDSLGNLLFYTNGVNVYNRNNQEMPNDSAPLLFGNQSTSQTLIVPQPAHSNLFYIFTLDHEAGPFGLNYSIVDMSLQGGLGDVAAKNVHLRDTMTEKVTAVYHCNGRDIWVMTHDVGNNVFVGYLLTDNGLSSPVITTVGSIHTDVHGQMKFSNDGKFIGSAVGYSGFVEVLNFDNETGKVGAVITKINTTDKVFGLEFSPDNSKFYFTQYGSTPSLLLQYDLKASDIPGSKAVMYMNYDEIAIMYSLQLGLDNKIYVTRMTLPYVGVINSPNSSGAAANYVHDGIYLDPAGIGVQAKVGLPNFVTSFFNPDFPNLPPCDTTTNPPPSPDTSDFTCGQIFVPTAFSPNNDQHNDAACVYGKCIVSMRFAIYDLWGEKVFETTDPNVCWDGKYKGKLMHSATFVYYLDARLSNGEPVFRKGNINLVR